MTPDRGPRAGRMEGHGFYTEHSEQQGDYGELGYEWLEEAAAAVPAPPAPLPFLIADMGAAGGGNSLEPVRRALAARPAVEPALVVHTDIPSNDFSALFELVGSDPRSYVDERAFALAEGRSFYERLLPDGILSLGWSSIAVHWLSRVPRPVPDHIYCSFASGEARAALREQSAADWRAFLSNRSAELRAGGRLVVVGGAATDDGSSGAEGLMGIVNESLRELLADGALTAQEYERMTIPTWNRTLAEFEEPLTDGELEGVMRLHRSALRALEDHYLAKFRSDGDLEAYVSSVTGFFRAAFEESLLAGLEPDRGRGPVAEVATRLWAGVGERIAADPERAACRWRVAVLEIERL